MDKKTRMELYIELLKVLTRPEDEEVRKSVLSKIDDLVHIL